MKEIIIDKIAIEIDEEKKKASVYLYGGNRKFMLKQTSSDIAQDYYDPLHVFEITDVYEGSPAPGV